MCRIMIDMIRRDPKYVSYYSQKTNLDSLTAAVSPARRLLMADAWEVRTLEYWRRWYAALRQNRGDLIGQYRAVKAVSDETESKDDQRTHEINNLITPSFSAVMLTIARVEEEHRLRETLMDLVEYRHKTGSWPESLATLPGTVEPDVFTEKPPIYRKTADGFILYSVGDNFKDDGGLAKRDSKTGAFDLVIKYPR